MRIHVSVLACCIVAAVLASEEIKPKKQALDFRGKRNLSYTIFHNYPTSSTFRSERRISTGSQQQRFAPPLFPGPRPYSPYRKDNNNDLSKPEDLQTDNNVVSENVYGPPKHYIERPIYIREPEPIIEIIIKESNVTLPPPPTPPPTPAPKKKEQVQVFYVKYKKNPNGHGKDSIIYEPPIPAISPPVEDEPEEEHVSYGPPQPVVTLPPPPSTTLRTIIKPDSETYHSPSGIKVTFGKEGFDYDKRSSKLDDDKEGSAPEPAITHPQARQLPLSQPSVQRRQPVLSSNYPPPPTFRPEIIRFSSPAFRAFTSSQYRQPSNRPFSSSPSKSTQGRLVPQFQAPLTRPVQFSQGLPSFQPEYTFDAPRQPVPYQPFTYLRSQQPQQPPSPSPSPSPSPVLQPQFPPQFEFPAHHFPAQQQLPSPQQQHTFDQQLAQRQKLQQQQQQQQQQQKQQQLPQRQPQRYQPAVPTKVQQYREPTAQPQLQYTQQPTAQPQSPQPSLQPQIQYNHQRQPSGSQQPQNVVPPGGELIPSLSKYEHHTSLRVGPSQSPLLTQGEQQEQQPQKQEQQQPTPEQYKQQIEQQFAQRQQQNYYSQQNGNQNYFLRNNSPVYQSTARPSTTTEQPTTQKPSTTTEKDDRALSVQLPDEVPDELRQQLLSSGILKNADISVLDYDKVGDIPLSALPPDQLANFYNAGGAQQIAGSAPVPSYLDKEGNPIKDEVDDEAAASETSEVRVPPPVEMKVVRYDPETEQGQEVQDYYVSDTATQVDPVVLDDQTYNKYLPLKVDGAEFPIPDVPELKGKSISSVVVLAPVTYSAKGQRKTRDAEVLSEEIQLVAENLKELVEHPTRENYEKFLQRENGTSSDKQAVILLVAESPSAENATEKEIFMYDIATKTVNKLSGELSTAFVEAAEANSDEEKGGAASASNTVESKILYADGAEDRIGEEAAEGDLTDSASDFVESKVPSSQSDLETEASEQMESFVDLAGNAVQPEVSSGYSRTDHN